MRPSSPSRLHTANRGSKRARELALGGTLNEVLDEDILRYVPALREELARVARSGAGEEGITASAGSG